MVIGIPDMELEECIGGKVVPGIGCKGPLVTLGKGYSYLGKVVGPGRRVAGTELA